MHIYDHALGNLSTGLNKQNPNLQWVDNSKVICHGVTCTQPCNRQSLYWTKQTDPKSMMYRQQQAEVVDYTVVVSLPSLDVMTTLMRRR